MTDYISNSVCIHCLGGNGPMIGWDSKRRTPYFDGVGERMIEPLWDEPIPVCNRCKEIYDKVPGYEHRFTPIGGAIESKP